MNKKDKIITNEEISELTNNATGLICVTDTGVVLRGSTPLLLTLYTVLTKEMQHLNFVDKDDIEKAFKLAFMNEDEKTELFSDLLDDMLKALNELKNEMSNK